MEIYEKARNEGGIKASMRMAMMTGLPSDKALEEKDTPEMIQKFNDAFDEIMKSL